MQNNKLVRDMAVSQVVIERIADTQDDMKKMMWGIIVLQLTILGGIVAALLKIGLA